jgi:periplasmic mercuric ion binding protein
VRAACESVDGQKSVNVEFEEKRVTVTYDPSKATPEAFLRAIEDAGYTPKLANAPAS